MEPVEVRSPCVGICQLSKEDICIGCYRHVEEIILWPSLNAEQRKAVIVKAKQREKDAVFHQ